MVKVKNRHRLKKKQIRSLVEEIFDEYGSDGGLADGCEVEIGTIDGFGQVVFVEKTLCFIRDDSNRLVVSLQGLNRCGFSGRRVIVDMGAVGFVTNGADVMAPGIVETDSGIEPNSIVWVCDVNNKKPLAIGEALVSSEEMKTSSKGKAVRTILWVGDALWEISKDLE